MFQSKIKSILTIISCLFLTISLNAQKDHIEEVWTDMRPVFNIKSSTKGTINITYPGNINIDNSKLLSAGISAIPQGSSMHHIVSDGWSMEYHINGDTGFSVSSFLGGGIRLSFPTAEDIFIVAGKPTVKPFRKTCDQWTMEFVPQKDGSVQVNMQPIPDK